MHKARTVRGGCGFAPAALSGVSRDGTWPDLVVVPATSVRELPEGISFEEGAALSHVGMAAYGALSSRRVKDSLCSARMAGSVLLPFSWARHWALASSP